MIFRVLAVHGKYKFPMGDFPSAEIAAAAMNDPSNKAEWDTNMKALVGSVPSNGYVAEARDG